MATRNIVPRATGEGSIGTSAKTWGAGYFDDVAVTNGVTAGTFTGEIVFSECNGTIKAYDTGVYVDGDNTSNRSRLILFTSANGNGFVLQAGNGSINKQLNGNPDGTLTWNGKNIPTKDVNVQAGSKGSISVSANSSTTTTVSFSTGFASTPIVVATPSTGYVGMSAQVSGISTSGCTITINNASSTARTITCNWVAISI